VIQKKLSHAELEIFCRLVSASVKNYADSEIEQITARLELGMTAKIKIRVQYDSRKLKKQASYSVRFTKITENELRTQYDSRNLKKRHSY